MLKGPLENTCAKTTVAPVQKNLLSVVAVAAVLAPLGPGSEDNVVAASGLDGRLRDAVARKPEFRSCAGSASRSRCSGRDRLDRHRWNVKNIAEHTRRIELGVMLASLAEVGQTRMR